MGKSDKKRVLIKIGTNTLTKETDYISRGKIEDIGRQISKLKEDRSNIDNTLAVSLI